MKKKILHIAYLDKFIPSFIEVIHQHFSSEPQDFITFGNVDKYPYQQTVNTVHFKTLNDIRALYRLVIALHTHDKIILHGLFMHQLTIVLCLMPWLHKKCQWIIWGADLYYHQLSVKNKWYRIVEFFRKILIRRLGALITYVEGDYYNAQQWYGAKGQLHECIMYKSNVYTGKSLSKPELDIFTTASSKKINLLVGNSADPTNNHWQVFDKLMDLDVDKYIGKIFCPLSYGDQVYAEQVRRLGESMFGDKFNPLMNFMPLTQYEKILDDVDIAIFAHNRQQAMGNTINILGRGKKVYMRADTSSYALFEKLGIKVFSLDNIVLERQSVGVAIDNNRKVRDYFCERNLVDQLKSIFS